MSDNCLHIVPKHQGEYPNSESKAKEILAWFQAQDMVETEPSDCILSEEKGYRFKPNITSIFNEGTTGAYRDNLWIHGLELTFEERTVFHPMEGAYLIITCPDCNQAVDEDIGYDWVGDWAADNGNDFPSCPNCHQQRHLSEYHIEPTWAFSNIGISLWNTHWDLSAEFIDEMKKLFATDIIIVYVRI